MVGTRALPFLEKQAESSSFWKGAAIYEQCITANEATLQQADFLYAYGYEFLGMAYSVYVHQVIEKIRQFGIDHVMFVAREGYLFQKIYEILSGRMPAAISPEVTAGYTYLSRVSTGLASTPQLTTREIALAAYKPDQQGLWSALKALGLPPEAFYPFAEAHGVDMRQPVSDYWNDQRLLTFLSDMDVQSQVRRYHQQAWENLRDYLRQCRFFGKNRKVALVDIGWEGTIQDNLVRAFNQMSDFPLLHGLYFGRRERKTFLKYSGSFSHGLIYDSRDKNIDAESIDIFVEIFEKGAGAPHPSTVGYERGDSGVCPVFKSAGEQSRQAEVAANGAIAAMQQGILDFARQYGECWQSKQWAADCGKPFLQGLIARHIAFPTRQEAYQVAHQLGQQAEDLGEDKVSGLAVVAETFWPAVRAGNFKAALQMFKQASWRPGSFRLMGIPGLLFIYRLKRFSFF